MLVDKFVNVPNRVLLYELYNYVSDMRGVISMLNSTIKWHGKEALLYTCQVTRDIQYDTPIWLRWILTLQIIISCILLGISNLFMKNSLTISLVVSVRKIGRWKHTCISQMSSILSSMTGQKSLTISTWSFTPAIWDLFLACSKFHNICSYWPQPGSADQHAPNNERHLVCYLVIEYMSRDQKMHNNVFVKNGFFGSC